MSVSTAPWRADVRLRRSRWQRVLVLLGPTLAALLLVLSPLPQALRLCALLALAGCTAYAWRRARHDAPASVVALREHGDDWWLETADGQGRRTVLLPGALLWGPLMVMRFGEITAAGPGRRYQVAVFPDSLPATDRRRLRVRLSLRRHGPVAVELDS